MMASSFDTEKEYEYDLTIRTVLDFILRHTLWAASDADAGHKADEYLETISQLSGMPRAPGWHPPKLDLIARTGRVRMVLSEEVGAAIEHLEAQVRDADTAAIFTVVGGKMDGGEVSWKYISEPLTFAQAVERYKTVQDYPMHRIECGSLIVVASDAEIGENSGGKA